MDVLDKDYGILVDDYRRVLALESMGVCPSHPTLQAVSKRWVAHEAWMDVSDHTHNSAKDHIARGAIKLSDVLVSRLHSWLGAKAKVVLEKVDKATSKATSLQRDIDKIKSRLAEAKELNAESIDTGMWTSKLCVEDKIKVSDCIAFANKIKTLDEIVKSYTVFATPFSDGPKVKKGGGEELRKLGKSTGWAVRRASGLLGYVNLQGTVKAWPLPGNVIVVLRSGGIRDEVIDFAVSRDGDYAKTITPLDKATAEKAVVAVEKMVEHLKTRDVKRGAFSYSGIYDKIEELKTAEIEEGDEESITTTTQRIKNALAVEDAITTALVRVCEGLTTYIRLSL